jgi:hypothetical protein
LRGGSEADLKSIEKQMEEMARMIAEEAGKRYPAYNRLVDGLGIRGNIKVQEALAELDDIPRSI